MALGVAMVAALVSVPHVFHDALWQDEVASARILDQPTLLAALHRIRATESTPPLWYVLGWLLHQAGVAILQVRLLSVVFMSTAAALIVLFARRVVSLPLAGLAGLLIAVGAGFVAHGHELRAYALLTVLVVLFAIVLDREVRQPTRRREAGLCACSAAGLLTHYFFVFTLVSAVIWLWLEPEAGRARRRATVGILAGCAAVLPFAPTALSQYGHNDFWWIGRFSFRTVVYTPWRLFSPLYGDGVVRVFLPVMFLVLAAAGACLLGRRSRQGRFLAALAFGPLLAAAFVWSLGFRVFSTRNLLECGPFFAVLVVAWLEFLPMRLRTMLAAGVAIAALGSAAHVEEATATPYDQVAADLVAEGWNSSDPIAVFGGFFAFRSPLEWYLPAHPPLALGIPTQTICQTVFVITPRAARARLRGVVMLDKAGSLVVGRLRLSEPIRKIHVLRGAAWMIDPLLRSSCLKAVTTGPFSARFSLNSGGRGVLTANLGAARRRASSRT